jgi:hypothetical protein
MEIEKKVLKPPYELYTVKKVSQFSVPSQDVTNLIFQCTVLLADYNSYLALSTNVTHKKHWKVILPQREQERE